MENKNIKKRYVVIVAIIVAFLVGYVIYRASFLEMKEIGEKFLQIFDKNIHYISYTYLAIFLIMYLVIYIATTDIKKGLQAFFNEEKKEMPKMPRKSIAFIASIIISAITTGLLQNRLILFLNNTSFETATPVFGYDIGYHIFTEPFIEQILYFLLITLIGLLIYTAIYYITVFNIYFDGINRETLKKSKFIKQIIRKIKEITIVIAGLVFVKTQNIVLQKFITIKGEEKYSLFGAGFSDVTVKLWGYRILSVVIVVSVYLAIRYFKMKNTSKVIKSLMVVPAYLAVMAIVLVGTKMIYVKPNELDIEKQYIKYNIDATKNAYGINIDEVSLDKAETMNKEILKRNDEIIKNINLVSEEVLLKDLNGSQTSKKYYYYENTKIGRYDINGESKLVYISPREISNTQGTRTYKNKTYEYTHGYGVILTSATTVNEKGNLENLQKTYEEQEEQVKITEPRIYFGMLTNNTAVTNKGIKEFDYPVVNVSNAENATNQYAGQAGLQLNFMDRVILAIHEKNPKLIFASGINKDSKILINRNIIERSKVVMPNLIYDENPYMVISDDGDMVWVLDAYTISNNYPYSQKTTIEVEGEKKEINYIRNSVKVLIDAYDGSVKFYITDRTDPIIMAYNNACPGLFEDEKIPEGISKHFVYPEFLYNIQSKIITRYHNTQPEVLYRSDDVWDVATQNTGKAITKVGTKMLPYYTVVNTVDMKDTLGLILSYTPYKKQNIISYLVGSYDEFNQSETLKIYKFPEDSNVLGPIQLDTQIEQNEIISKEVNSLNTTGVKLIKQMVILPIENTLLYVEPIYQIYTNETEALPTLKKIIVASGNKVAIGDNLQSAMESLVSQYAVDIQIEDTEDIDGLIDIIIRANQNLETSTNNKDWEMMGKDLKKLQDSVKKLETLKSQEQKDNEEAVSGDNVTEKTNIVLNAENVEIHN